MSLALVAALGLARPSSAQGGGNAVETQILCGEGGLGCRAVGASIALPGGLTGQLLLSFEDATLLTPASFDVTAELVDPRDPQLTARLPGGTFIPSDFPVLVRIDSGAGSALTFRGEWSLELVTENLEFTSHTPYRLFRAPIAGQFQDISVGLGSGSFRVKGAGAGFSEFLIAADLRRHDAVTAAKLDRLQTVLSDHSGDVGSLFTSLHSQIDQARTAFDNGDRRAAAVAVGQLIALVRQDGGAEIPDTSEPGSGQVGVAGQLLAAGSTLRNSLVLGLQSAQGGMSGFSRTLVAGNPHTLDLSVQFEQAFVVDPEDLDIEAELIDVDDPALLARLPAGVQVPAELPVLLRITPDPASDQAFRGSFEIEIQTDSLDFLGGSPLRLFKAPEGGAFEDITRTYGLGSLRLGGGGASFSELVIASDLRPVNDVVDGKLQRLEASAQLHAGVLPAAVQAQLAALLVQLRLDIEGGLDAQAIAQLDAIVVFIKSNDGTIPSIWRAGEAVANVAGELRSLADTLRFTLSVRSQTTIDPADVNRDGKVDVGDVLHVINLVFG